MTNDPRDFFNTQDHHFDGRNTPALPVRDMDYGPPERDEPTDGDDSDVDGDGPLNMD